MKILYHHRTQGTGAEGIHITEIINCFKKLGHDVYVVSPPGVDLELAAGANPFEKKKSRIAKGMHFISRAIPQFLFEILEILYNIVSYCKLWYTTKKNKIDFIYERHSFFAFAAVRLAKKRNIPIIVEVNELAGKKRIRKQVFTKLAKKYEMYVFKNASAIIVVSDFLKNIIKEYGIDQNKIIVMPNAVDCKKFTSKGLRDELRNRYKINKKGIVVGFIGWFVHWHNIELLIDVFSDISHQKDVYLCLIGDGVLRGQLKTRARDRGVESKVIFPGAVAHENVPDYIDMMDICVIPESNNYRSPIKMFEYMAMAKPVVAPKIEPIEDILVDNVNGVLFEGKNENSLRRCLLDLIDDDQKREKIGKEARKTVLSKHLWKHNAEKVLETYNKIKMTC